MRKNLHDDSELRYRRIYITSYPTRRKSRMGAHPLCLHSPRKWRVGTNPLYQYLNYSVNMHGAALKRIQPAFRPRLPRAQHAFTVHPKTHCNAVFATHCFSGCLRYNRTLHQHAPNVRESSGVRLHSTVHTPKDTTNHDTIRKPGQSLTVR